MGRMTPRILMASGERSTSSLEAQEAYGRGLLSYKRGEYSEATREFERAHRTIAGRRLSSGISVTCSGHKRATPTRCLSTSGRWKSRIGSRRPSARATAGSEIRCGRTRARRPDRVSVLGPTGWPEEAEWPARPHAHSPRGPPRTGRSRPVSMLPTLRMIARSLSEISCGGAVPAAEASCPQPLTHRGHRVKQASEDLSPEWTRPCKL
jgi:hypothetical protein